MVCWVRFGERPFPNERSSTSGGRSGTGGISVRLRRRRPRVPVTPPEETGPMAAVIVTSPTRCPPGPRAPGVAPDRPARRRSSPAAAAVPAPTPGHPTTPVGSLAGVYRRRRLGAALAAVTRRGCRLSGRAGRRRVRPPRRARRGAGRGLASAAPAAPPCPSARGLRRAARRHALVDRPVRCTRRATSARVVDALEARAGGAALVPGQRLRSMGSVGDHPSSHRPRPLPAARRRRAPRSHAWCPTAGLPPVRRRHGRVGPGSVAARALPSLCPARRQGGRLAGQRRRLGHPASP